MATIAFTGGGIGDAAIIDGAEPGRADECAALRFQLGARTLWRVRRALRPVSCSLDDVLTDRVPPLAAAWADGYHIRSVPVTQLAALRARCDGWLLRVHQRYPRHHMPMAGLSFDDWWNGFSGKTRSTLSRKSRRLGEQAEGGFAVTCHRTPQEVRDFMAMAAPLSRRTYQDRLLDAGLPSGPEAVEQAVAAAARDELRAFLLHLDGRPIAYLYLPVEQGTLIYAHLGYDPDHLQFSPGTVLHVEAMRHLFAERRFRAFDFTEGDGAHKALFGRGSVPCADILLLRPTLRNRMLILSLRGFDRAVASSKAMLAHTGLADRVRARLRG